MKYITTCSLAILLCLSVSPGAYATSATKTNVPATSGALKTAVQDSPQNAQTAVSKTQQAVSEKGNTAAKPVASLVTYLGEVQYMRAGSAEAKPLKRGMFFFPGDRIKSKVNGRAEIRFIDGTMIRISPDSDFEFSADAGSKKKSVFVYSGRIWNKVVKGTNFEVESSFAVCAVKGTEFDVAVSDQMQVWVAEGLVAIQNDKGKVEAGKNTLTTVAKDVAPDKKPITQDQLPPRDELKSNLAAVLSSPGAKTEDEPFAILIKLMDISKNEIKRTNLKLKFVAGSESIQVGPDTNTFKPEVETEIVMGQGQIYAKAKPGQHELTVTGADIPGTTFGVNVNAVLKKREVLVDFTDDAGQTQQLKLEYDLK